MKFFKLKTRLPWHYYDTMILLTYIISTKMQFPPLHNLIIIWRFRFYPRWTNYWFTSWDEFMFCMSILQLFCKCQTFKRLYGWERWLYDIGVWGRDVDKITEQNTLVHYFQLYFQAFLMRFRTTAGLLAGRQAGRQAGWLVGWMRGVSAHWF